MSRQRLTTSDPRDIAEYVDQGLDALEERLISCIDRKFEEQREWFRDGFPGGDMTKHRLDHERHLESEADFKSLRRSLLEKGSAGLLFALVAMNWEAVKLWVREVLR